MEIVGCRRQRRAFDVVIGFQTLCAALDLKLSLYVRSSGNENVIDSGIDCA